MFYTKSSDYTFNPLYYEKKEGKPFHTNKVQGKGQMLIYDRETTPIRKIEEYKEKGYSIVDVADGNKVKEHDVWTYVRDKSLNFLNSQSKERTGYPTQKPLALLERIIQTSSNEGDMVLDPFCGCATTIIAAQRLRRKWIGIDQSPMAVKLVRRRMKQGELGADFIPREDIPVRKGVGKVSPDIKQILYGKQRGYCALCGVLFPYVNLTIDHKVPRKKGGGEEDDNKQLLCGYCNSVKGGNRTMSEAKARLKEIGAEYKA